MAGARRSPTLALAAAFFSARIAGADAPVVSQYSVEPPQHLTVGDRVKVFIVVEADSGTQIQIAPGGLPEDMALAESARFSTRDRGSGRIEVRIDLVLAPFLVGEYDMPPIKLRYRDRGGVSGDLQTPASKLFVESVIPPAAAISARDLKPQAELGAPAAPPYGLIAATVALLALALALLALAWRRTRRQDAFAGALPETGEEPLGTEDAARRALDIAGARFAADGEARAYYASLSATMRGYLTERFGFPAFALTTAEMQAQMTSRGMDRWQARLAGGLLEQCDAVMYAHYLPAAERADADLTAAYEIVEMSRPAEEPEAVPAS